MVNIIQSNIRKLPSMLYVLFFITFICLFTGCSEKMGTLYDYMTDNEETDLGYSTQAVIVDAFESYFGEWIIVEDFGYHGIHRSEEVDIFEVGKTVIFQREFFRYEDSIDISWPIVRVQIMESASIEQVHGMQYPHHMGFEQGVWYAYFEISEYSAGTTRSYSFYILTDNEIIFEGDVHRYYRAIRGTY